MNALLTVLRRLVPGTFLALVFVVLSATGFFLHWTPRFQSLSWGLTEIVHVWIGWAALVFVAGYLVHHLARTWGPLSTLQRILGLALTVDIVLALLTGVLVVEAPVGGPPKWAVPVHFVSTFVLLGLFVWHSAAGWTRWLKRTGRAVVEGPLREGSAPATSSLSVAAAAEPDHREDPADEGESATEEPQDEGKGLVDEPQGV